MSFLSPLFLIGAVAAAVPILLHLLKREPEARLKFSAVKLLRRAPVENARRRRLKELLLLALRVAALLLLAIAFARPFFPSRAAFDQAGVTVIALDISLSLSAPGQFERARQMAKDAIARSASSDLVAVVTFADTAQIAVRPSRDRGVARAAVDAASPGFGATRYRAGLHAASELLNGRRGTIVVVSDMQESGWDAGDHASVPESARIEVADVGAPPANLAVTAVRPIGDRVVAIVRNAGGASREARVRLTVDGVVAAETRTSIGSGQWTEVTLAGARGTNAVVSVDDSDGVQADNVRYLVLNSAGRPTVLVVTATGSLERDAFYLRHAILAAGAGGAAYEVEGVSGAQLSSWDRARFDRYAVVALVSTRGLDGRGRELLSGYARDGGGVLLAAGPTVDAEVAAGAQAGVLSLETSAASERERERRLVPSDVRHPIFQAFGARMATLGLVTFRRTVTIRGSDCETLARFTTGEAALVECALGEGRVLALASDLDNGWNDFPLHATFVPFLHEAVRYLSGPRPHAGEYTVGNAPPGVPSKPGIVALTKDSAGRASSRRVAVNVDSAESDPGRLTADEFQVAVTSLKDVARAEGRIVAGQEEDRQHIWQYVLALMVAVLALESFFGARTA